MPTCRDIIIQALRMSKVIASGEEPTADEAADGMFALQSLYEAWAAGGMFGRLRDTLTATAMTAEPGQRVRALASAVVTLPIVSTDDGDDVPLFDLSAIEIIDVTAGARALYLFESARGGWSRIDALALGDEAPLAMRSRAGLAAALASSFVEQFGGTITAGIQRQAIQFRSSLRWKAGASVAYEAAAFY